MKRNLKGLLKLASLVKKADPPNKGLNSPNPMIREANKRFGYVPQVGYLGNDADTARNTGFLAEWMPRLAAERNSAYDAAPTVYNYIRAAGALNDPHYDPNNKTIYLGSYPYNSGVVAKHENGHHLQHHDASFLARYGLDTNGDPLPGHEDDALTEDPSKKVEKEWEIDAWDRTDVPKDEPARVFGINTRNEPPFVQNAYKLLYGINPDLADDALDAWASWYTRYMSNRAGEAAAKNYVHPDTIKQYIIDASRKAGIEPPRVVLDMSNSPEDMGTAYYRIRDYLNDNNELATKLEDALPRFGEREPERPTIPEEIDWAAHGDMESPEHVPWYHHIYPLTTGPERRNALKSKYNKDYDAWLKEYHDWLNRRSEYSNRYNRQSWLR